MDKILRKSCPICGRDNTLNEKIFERDFSGAASIVPFLRYDVIRCTECGMLYAGNIEESMSLDEYYAMLSRYEMNYNQRYDETYVYKFVQEYLPQNAEIIDVGCAGGGILNEFKKHGYTNLIGLEPSQKNCEYASREYGITVYPKMLDEYVNDTSAQKYDLVIMVHVLEHVLDLQKCIKDLSKLVKDNGIICLNMPDADMFKDYANDLYQQFSTEHVNYFTRYSLTVLMAKMGFMPVKTSESTISLWRKNKTNMVAKSPACIDKNIDEYMRHSANLAKRMKKIVDENTNEMNGYYIWGVSTQTAMLVQLGIIDISKIRGLFDGNKNYQGKVVYDNVVMPPDKLKELPNYPVIISSRVQNEIKKYAIDTLKIENDLVELLQSVW